MINNLVNNKVMISGVINSDLQFSHKSSTGESFYKFSILVHRKNGWFDVIPVIVSFSHMSLTKIYKWRTVMVAGQFRSYDEKNGDKGTKLILYVYAKEICCCFEENDGLNEIELDGYITKKPVYRTTPSGKKIADVILAVNRYRNSDYIPCIFWGMSARRISEFKAGDHIKIKGRIQSREYLKESGKGITEKRIAYEVSVRNFEQIAVKTDSSIK